MGLSFHRANPKFGGRSSLAAPKGLTPTVTLPDCLQALLGRHVLRMDRRELLARASAQLQKDAELQVRLEPMHARRPAAGSSDWVAVP